MSNEGTKNLYAFWFAQMPGMGRKRKRELLEEYDVEELVFWPKEKWKNNLKAGEWKKVCPYVEENSIEETEKRYNQLSKRGISFLFCREKEFPEKLKQIEDGPIGIYIKGTLPKEKRTIAIVGSRNPTAYGREMARFFARELSGAGVGVISGLAQGIDAAAHEGALEAKKRTYGILGCGVDRIYPRENFFLYQKIAAYGAVISEYKPGEPPLAYRFPERNRLISGLADGVLIVEARERSGSLITADCGLEQGKEIYALPGRAGDPLSEGCNWLIRQGAKMVTEPVHILEDIFPECEKSLKNHTEKNKLLDNKDKIVYDCLGLEPKYVEDIIRQTNLSVSEGLSILFRLELNGYIKQVVKDYYIVCL